MVGVRILDGTYHRDAPPPAAALLGRAAPRDGTKRQVAGGVGITPRDDARLAPAEAELVGGVPHRKGAAWL